MNQINIYDYLELYDSGDIGTNNLMVNLRGTNGSGKSSVPFSFINSDKDTFELTYEYEGKPRTVATVCPNEGWMFLGSYRNKCGGLDTFRTQEQTSDALELIWKLPYNILIEGVISSTIFSTYANLFHRVNADNDRRVIVVTLAPPLDVCLDRIKIRNGGKEVKVEQVAYKYKIILRNFEKFQNAGFNCVKLDNTNVQLEDTKKWFLEEVNKIC